MRIGRAVGSPSFHLGAWAGPSALPSACLVRHTLPAGPRGGRRRSSPAGARAPADGYRNRDCSASVKSTESGLGVANGAPESTTRRVLYPAATACYAICLLLTLAASLPARAQERSLDEVLDLSLADLLNLRVETALKQPYTINQVPATVRVITADQIRERGYLTLEDALADLPGFQFRNIQGFNSYVFLRGVPSQNNKLLVLVDGVQINELNSGGFYAGGQFNLAAVQQIEIVYGPASSLYGTNAVSGIVNLITRAPESSEGGRIGLSAGNFDTRSVDFHYGAHDPDRRLGFTLSGMYKHSDKADLGGLQGDGNWTGALDNFETDLSLDGRLRARSGRQPPQAPPAGRPRAVRNRTSRRAAGDGVSDRRREVAGDARRERRKDSEGLLRRPGRACAPLPFPWTEGGA